MFPEFAENVGWFGPCGPDVWCQRRRDLGVLFYVRQAMVFGATAIARRVCLWGREASLGAATEVDSRVSPIIMEEWNVPRIRRERWVVWAMWT
jgi:hypothetical protein